MPSTVSDVSVPVCVYWDCGVLTLRATGKTALMMGIGLPVLVLMLISHHILQLTLTVRASFRHRDLFKNRAGALRYVSRHSMSRATRCCNRLKHFWPSIDGVLCLSIALLIFSIHVFVFYLSSLCLSLSLSFCPSVCLSLSLTPCLCLSVSISVCLCLCLSVSLSQFMCVYCSMV